MRKDFSVYTDVLCSHLKNGRLDEYLENCKNDNKRVYIPFGVRKEVEESLETEAETKAWHRILKEGLAQGVIVRSPHRYDFEKDYKVFYKKLNSIDPDLDNVRKHIITLSLQLGIFIDTNDSKIHRALNEIKIRPHLQKYLQRLYSKSNFRIH